MAEPTGSLIVYDLVLEVARAAKIAYYGSDGQQRAMVPINEHDFDRCLHVVTNGVKRFIHDAPNEGWHWMKRQFQKTLGIVQTEGTVDSGDATTLVDDALAAVYDTDNEINGYYVYDTTQEIQAVVTAYTALTGTVTVAGWLDYLGNAPALTPSSSDAYSITDVQTVAGDKTRYFLPDNFGEIGGKITYGKGSNVGSIDWVSESFIRERRSVVQTNSDPMWAAIRPVLNRKLELIVDPSPTDAKVLEFPYRIGFDKLRALTGEASSGSVTTLVDSTFANRYPDDYFNGWVMRTLDGTGKFSYAPVTDFTGSTCTFTVADWLSVWDKSTSAAVDPTNGTFYYITDGKEHPAGNAFDFAIRAAILVEAEMEFGQLERNFTEEYLNVHLPEAHRMDARQQPVQRGSMQPGRPHGRTRVSQPRDPNRTWSNVTYG